MATTYSLPDSISFQPRIRPLEILDQRCRPRIWRNFASPNASLMLTKYLQCHSANDFALDHEVPFLNDALRQAQRRLAEHDAVLARVRAITQQLEQQRDDLSTTIQRCSAMIVSSIRHLPIELFIKIFTLCWSNARAESWTSFSAPSSHITLILSQVCARWRALAIALPALWSFINLNFDILGLNAVSEEDIRRFAGLCLQRSKDKPLDIILHAPCNRPEFCSHQPALTLLATQCHRWRNVDLGLQERDVLYLPQSLRMLERLLIQRKSNSTPLTQWLANEQALRLHSNFTILTELKLGSGCSLDVIFDFLKRGTSLRALHLRSPYRDLQPPLPHVTSMLQSLTLEECVDMLPQLTLPRLAELSMRDNLETERFPTMTFCEFLQRSQPHLTSLTIGEFCPDVIPLAEVFGMLPYLNKLSIHDCDDYGDASDGFFPDAFLRRMMISRGKSVPLPNLVHLELECRTDYFVTAAMVEMIKSRRSTAALAREMGFRRLIFFQLTCNSDNFDFEINMQLNSVEGLYVHVHHWW
ncbi:hypothetical protein WG66_009375 [Moniliophthora roreri]|nr:hypothetical protein WG66_009375 [Moniliophthora roreri]